VDADLHAGMCFAKASQDREQGVDRAFVGAEGELAALEAFKFEEALLDLVAEIEKTFGVFAEKGAGIGETHGPGAADKERLLQGLFELADGEADGRLGAIEAFGSAAEASFLGYGQKNLQFT